MNTDRLYEFLTLAQTLNYSKAAETLYISQSILSKHIKDLEKELDVALFIRNTHSVTLTNAGQILVKEAAPLIDKCNSARNLLHMHDLAHIGTIRIGCILELSYASHIQVFISKFMQRYPDIHLQIDIITNGIRPDNLYEYDILLSPCKFLNLKDNTQMQFIRSHGTYAVLYPGHHLLSKALLQLKELKGETIIVPFQEELYGPYAQNWNLVKRFTRDDIHCIAVPNLSSALFHVSIGAGIAIVPRYVKNMIPVNAFLIGIANESCLFNEYIYYHNKNANGAAKLFYQEYCNAYTKYDS